MPSTQAPVFLPCLILCSMRQVMLGTALLAELDLEVLPGPPEAHTCFITGANARNGQAGVTNNFDVNLKVGLHCKPGNMLQGLPSLVNKLRQGQQACAMSMVMYRVWVHCLSLASEC